MTAPVPRRPHSIATRSGDDGTTSLLFGQRVSKSDPRIEAVGTLDELNVALGSACVVQPAAVRVAELRRIQHELIAVMGEISCPAEERERLAASSLQKIDPGALDRLDAAVEAIEAKQPKFDGWATPGASPAGAALEQARVAARRAERRMVGLSESGLPVRPLLLRYLNRLSDLLWLMAREAENP